MRVLFVGGHDWANFAHRVARALRTANVDARVLVAHRHPYGYVEDTWAPGELEAWASGGIDWLLSTGDGSYSYLAEIGDKVEHRNRGALHVGSYYRREWAKLNELDKRLGMQVQFLSVDSMHRADPALPAYPMWLAPEHWVEPDERRDGLLHCPSKRSTKGTSDILWAAERAGVELTLIEGAAPSDVLAAMSRAAAYIDQLNPDVGGIGCAAFEAAALGCAVITDGRHWPVHVPWAPMFSQARDREDLAALLRELKGTGGRVVRTGWHMHHAWRSHRYAVEWAGQERVAAYWLERLQRHAKP